MFYASKALLLAIGEDPVKHTGVITFFGSNYSGCKRSSEYSSNLHENFTPISHVWGILYSL